MNIIKPLPQISTEGNCDGMSKEHVENHANSGEAGYEEIVHCISGLGFLNSDISESQNRNDHNLSDYKCPEPVRFI